MAYLNNSKITKPITHQSLLPENSYLLRIPIEVLQILIPQAMISLQFLLVAIQAKCPFLFLLTDDLLPIVVIDTWELPSITFDAVCFFNDPISGILVKGNYCKCIPVEIVFFKALFLGKVIQVISVMGIPGSS